MNKKNNDKIEKEVSANKDFNQMNGKRNKNKRKKQKPVQAFKEKEKIFKSQKVKYIVELTVVLIFSLIMLILLCNRTFFRENYKTSKISLDIPLLMFYEKDDGKEIVLKTLRKSQYVKDYFEKELENMTIYKCENTLFYYNDESKTAIYSIDVKKDFAIKTVTIKYAHGDANCLCNSSERDIFKENVCEVG